MTLEFVTLQRRSSRRLCCAVVATVALVGCSSGTKQVIDVGSVGRADVIEHIQAAGVVTPRAEATLVAPADSVVSTVEVRDGQDVTAGTVIVRLSSPAAEQRLVAARQADAQAGANGAGGVAGVGGVGGPAALTALAAQLDAAAQAAFGAADAAARNLPQGAQRDTALTQLAAAEARYATAKTQADAAISALGQGLQAVTSVLGALTGAQRTQTQATLTAAQSTVDALVVRSPINGQVQLGGTGGATSGGAGGLDLSQLPTALQGAAASALGTSSLTGSGKGASTTAADITAGAKLAAGSPVAMVVDSSQLSVVAQVDETDVFLTHPGELARVELDAVPGGAYPASVGTVELTPTSSTGGGVSYRVHLYLHAGRLADGTQAPTPRPGMSAVATIEVRRSIGAITVPVSAVIRDGARDAVWVAEGGRARKRLVTIGAESETTAAVTDGLAVGERVVVKGADRVTEGQKLRH